ncbi:MAG: uracil-DNA glycosylase [Chloroflexota bacterium]
MIISDFVHKLATAVPPQNCTNPYAGERPFAQNRRHNLQTYLELMQQQPPRLLLLGEAPGYRGCRLTGIPFTSPQILTQLNSFLGQTASFQPGDDWPEIVREASASVVWGAIGSWQPLPLLWNVFPFHPHQPGNPQSNRTPKTSEIVAGRPFLHHLLHLFPEAKIVAVGQKAAGALAKWAVAHTAVRHPSHGGAKQFQTALSELHDIL